MGLRVGVLGASGYGGAGLVARLAAHPEVAQLALASRSLAGRATAAAWPQRAGLGDDPFVTPDEAMDGSDVVFCATPHGATAPWVRRAVDAGARVVDLSADSRLPPATYARWYREPEHPELWPECRYGLVEWHREDLAGARIVAAPGCNATAVSLALAPFAASGLLPEDAVCTVLAGASGAGRDAGPALQYAEANEDVRAYKPAGTHRHVAEIETTLGRATRAGRALRTHAEAPELRVSFTPHLVPATRGILASCTFRPTRALTDDAAARAVLAEAYAMDPLVHVQEELPHTKAVANADRAVLTARVDARSGLVSAYCVIDNLGKGAAGQAVQGFNVALGFPETTALHLEGTWP